MCKFTLCASLMTPPRRLKLDGQSERVFTKVYLSHDGNAYAAAEIGMLKVQDILQIALQSASSAAEIDATSCESTFRSSCILLHAVLSSLDELSPPAIPAWQSTASTILFLFDSSLLEHFFESLMSCNHWMSNTYTAFTTLLLGLLNGNVAGWVIEEEAQRRIANKMCSSCFLRRSLHLLL